MNYSQKRRALYRRFAICYSGILGMILVALFFSVMQGAGWKPVLAGLPVYLTSFVVVTREFVKELRGLKQEKQLLASQAGKPESTKTDD